MPALISPQPEDEGEAERLIRLSRQNPLGLQAAVVRERSLRSLPYFLRKVWEIVEGARVLAWNWHIELVCRELMKLEQGDFRRLLVNLPPRLTKSTIVSVAFPCWAWTRKPSLQFMFASYSWGLAQEHAYKRRTILESAWFQKHFGDVVRISGDRSSIMDLGNDARGVMHSRGAGGTITGLGGDYLILDDPNNIDEPESEVQRQSLHQWFDVTWSTRANDQKTVKEVIIQQRTHEQDISGHALTRAKWKHVKIPMEFEPKEACEGDPRTEPGELIDPERFPRAEAEDQKKRVGPYAWAGQYQQTPAPLEGGIVKRDWVRHYEGEGPRTLDSDIELQLTPSRRLKFKPSDCTRICTIDPATSDKEITKGGKLLDPDYFVISSWGVYGTAPGTILVLLDCTIERITGPHQEGAIQAAHKRWRFAMIGVESIGFQLSLFQRLAAKGLPVRELSKSEDALIRIDGDKTARLYAATPLMAAGRLWVPTFAPYMGEFLKQLIFYPNAAHDDVVDAVANACAITEHLGERVGKIVPKRPERAQEDGSIGGQVDRISPLGGGNWRSEIDRLQG